ncbi:MAG TPA: NADH-quinone oxidoreductase subunit C [Steroidobacteraceae bacterium]|nr:NADH-quinone oxidoreductase subunit C [Steroidobacteraceae bacterium]
MSDSSSAAAAAPEPTRLESLARAVAVALPEQLRAVPNTCGELTYEVDGERLLQAAAVLRDAPGLKFEMCMDVCGVDYLEHGRAEWKTQDATSSGFSRGVARDGALDAPLAAGRRFAVVYHLLSVSLNQRLRMRVFCADEPEPMVDSVTGIWAGTDWFERETFDMFGIMFRGHPDLRRLLTDYGFIGHPFRKDFPLSGNVEVRYDPEKGRVVYQPVSIDPRVLVPKVIRHDNRYDPQLTNAPVAAHGKSSG